MILATLRTVRLRHSYQVENVLVGSAGRILPIIWRSAGLLCRWTGSYGKALCSQLIWND